MIPGRVLNVGWRFDRRQSQELRTIPRKQGRTNSQQLKANRCFVSARRYSRVLSLLGKASQIGTADEKDVALDGAHVRLDSGDKLVFLVDFSDQANGIDRKWLDFRTAADGATARRHTNKPPRYRYATPVPWYAQALAREIIEAA